MTNMMRRSNRNTILTGKSIYKDKHGQTLVFDEKTNIVYRISSDNEDTLSLYECRSVLSVTVFIVIYALFTLPAWFALIVAAALYVILEKKRKSFLESCPQSNGFRKADQALPIADAISLDKTALITRIVMYSVLSVVLGAITFIFTSNLVLQVACFIVAIFALFFVIKYIGLLMRRSA